MNVFVLASVITIDACNLRTFLVFAVARLSNYNLTMRLCSFVYFVFFLILFFLYSLYHESYEQNTEIVSYVVLCDPTVRS